MAFNHFFFVSSLHGPQLTGRKLLVYCLENKPESELDGKTLLYEMKVIQKKANCKVEDILQMAVSSSICNYFRKVQSVVIPRVQRNCRIILDIVFVYNRN